MRHPPGGLRAAEQRRSHPPRRRAGCSSNERSSMSPLALRPLRTTGLLWLLVGFAAVSARTATADTCGYPDSSNPPRSGVIFNESTVLRAFSPVTATTIALGQNLTIKAFYNDEHALTLGVRRVLVKT